MTTLQDAKLSALQTLTGSTGHVNDLEQVYLSQLVTGPAISDTIDGLWDQVFTEAAIPAGQFNDRAVQYIKSIHGAPPSEDYNAHWSFYWEQGGTSLVPAGAPPFFSNVQHWFDFDDAATMFSDTAGLIPIQPGDEILRMSNKGSDGQPLISTDTPGSNANPVYLPNSLAGLGVAHGPSAPVNTPDLGVSNPLWLSVGNAAGISMFVVTRKSDPQLAFLTNSVWTSSLISAGVAQQTSTTWRERYGGNTPDTLKTIINNEWGWHYMVAGPSAGGVVKARTAGVVEVVVADPYVPVGATGGPFNIALTQGDTAATFIYDRELTPAELLTVIAYIDARFGVMPFVAPALSSPPAVSNLLHHVDASDASTVWADAAATIPATNGVTVERIDNKGLRGTPFLRVGFGGTTYRTGVLNGKNVIEFTSSGGQLSIIAESPGLAISTTGCTLAMVTRRRAAAPVGNDILWRWTPFAGSPGPGLRLEGGTEGFISQITGIADEDLSVQPAVLDTWYLIFISLEAAGSTDDSKFGSPGPEVAGPFGDPTDIPDLADFRFGTSIHTVESVEAWFWDRALTSAERDQLIAHADLKYATLPHL